MDAIVYDKVGKEAEKVREALYGIYPQETITDAAIASFDDGADSIPVKALTVGIEPVQDLHGYDNPWPAGGSKNKLPNNAETSTIQGVTFTVNADGTITANGTSIGWGGLTISTFTLAAGEYKLYSLVSFGGSACYLSLFIDGSEIIKTDAVQSGVSFTVAEETTCIVKLFARPNVQLNNVVCYPMILLASETDTTYAPYSNICPISGWTGAEINGTGVNIWDEEWEQGGISETGGIIADSTKIRSKNYIPVNPGMSVYLKTSNAATYLWFYDKDKTFISISYSAANNVVTIPDNCYFVKLRSGNNSNPATTYNHDISINYPSTDTEYHPYTGNQISVTFPSAAGTVYGGTLTLNPDRTGTMVVDHKGKDMGEMSWSYASNENRFYSTSISSEVNKTETLDTSDELKCSIFQTSALPVTNLGTLGNGTICVYTNGTTYARWLEYTSPNDFKTAVTGQTLWYPLAAPITISCTAEQVSGILTTLYGTNNIWADTGNIEKLTYRADLGKYIDSHITTAVANALNA